MMACRFKTFLIALTASLLIIPNAFSGGNVHFEGQLTFPLSSKKIPKDIKNESWSGEVVGVADGDTITALNNGKGERIRLYGIDTPEKRQAFGKKAKQFTSDMVYGKTVEVKIKDIDRYGRTVALVNVDGESLNEALVKAGYAWVYQRYCKESFCKDWLSFEGVARYGKIGLWSDPDPEPPWDFRRKK
jgi:micrococcal nuclease